MIPFIVRLTRHNVTVMRLLSFLSQVENELRARPAAADGPWLRRVAYAEGVAQMWRPDHDLLLMVRVWPLQDEELHLQTTWQSHGREVTPRIAIYSGRTGFSWSEAAAEVARTMPAGEGSGDDVQSPPAVSRVEPPLAATG